MFSLLIAIVTIALVVVLVAISAYYGGSSLSEAAAQADAARLRNEEQQILGAADVFNADHARWPANVQELVEEGYLTSIPKGAVLAQAPTLQVMSSAYAQSAGQGWGTPLAGRPIYTTGTSVPKEVCRKYNLLSRGDDGILHKPFEDLNSQCYGSDGTYRIVVRKAGTRTASLGDALAPQSVVEGGLPAADAGDGWWDVAPSAAVKVPLDPDKSPLASLGISAGDEVFPLTRIGTTAKSEVRLLTNLSTIKAYGLSLSAPSGFSIVDNNCSAELAPGAGCTFALAFTPSAEQAYGGQVQVVSQNAQSAGINVQGEGFAWHATLAIPEFGSVPVNSAIDQVATLTNTSLAELPVTVPGSSSVSGSGYSFVETSCGEGLAPSASCTVTVRYSPTAATVSSGVLTVSTGAGAQMATLAGGGITSNLAFSPTAISSFGGQQVNSSATSQVVTLRNTGGLAASGLELANSAGFSIENNTCGTSLAAGGTCTLNVRFTPTRVGYYSGTLTASNGSSSASMPLSGSGVQGAISFLPPGTIFYATVSLYADFNLVISNSGPSSVSLGAITVSGNPELTVAPTGHTCGSTLASGASCYYVGRFTPTVRGARPPAIYLLSTSVGAFTAEVATANGTQTTMAFTPAAGVNFGTVIQGAEVTSTAFTLKSTGNSVAYQYTLPLGYQLVDSTCPSSGGNFGGGGSCVFKVKFAPGVAGNLDGEFLVSWVGGSASLSLKGTATALEGVQLGGGTFGESDVGSKKTRSFTLYNNSSTAVTLSPATVSGTGEFVLSSSGSTCSSSLAAGATCSYSVDFTPTARGARPAGTLTAFTSAGTRTYALTGTGAQAVLKMTTNMSLDYGQRQVGQINNDVPYAILTVTNSGDATNNLSLKAPAGFALFINNCQGTSLGAGESCTTGLTAGPEQTKLGLVAGSITAYAGSVSSNTLNASYTAVLPSGSLPASASATAQVGNSQTVTLTLTNTGVYRMVMGTPQVQGNTAEFLLAPGTTCSANLAVNASCIIKLNFTPTAKGARPPATLRVNIGANLSQAVYLTSALSGEGS